MEKKIVPRLRVHNLFIHGVGPVSLDIEKGECVGLSGPSGSGKSLFLRAIADMEPHGGTTCLDGTEQALIPAAAWRRQVGLLLSESTWWSDTVGDHFVGVRCKRIEPAWVRRRHSDLAGFTAFQRGATAPGPAAPFGKSTQIAAAGRTDGQPG